MVTDPQTHTNSHRQDRLQYIAPLSLYLTADYDVTDTQTAV